MSGFFVAPRIAWGTGAVEQLSGLGLRRPLLLVDPKVAGLPPVVRVAEELRKGGGAVEVETVPDVPNRVEAVETVVGRWLPHPPDAVVAVGGGRTLDAAKAVRLRLVRPDVSLVAPPPILDLPWPTAVTLVAIPSTSGSGAEATGTLDLLGPSDAPIELSDRGLVPDWALVDPGFSDGLDPSQVVDGAGESLAQAVESYLSAWSNPLSDALALDAASTVVGRLAHAVRWSDDPDARAALHYAASAAGLAAGNAQRGLTHALARALEGPTGLGYGRLSALLLPWVLEYDHPAARLRIEAIAHRVTPPEEPGHPGLVPRLRRLYELVRLPATLRAAGARTDAALAVRDDLAERVRRAPAALANPRVPTVEDLQGLLDAVLRA